MFLLNYFYGNKNQPCEQGRKQEEEWVLVDKNGGPTLATSLDEYGILEKDEISLSVVDPLGEHEPQPSQLAINQEPLEAEVVPAQAVVPVVAAEEEQRIQVQNPVGRPGRIVPGVINNNPVSILNGIKTEPAGHKAKNNCKKQAQRRADKYKGGVWSGRSNDRKCGKCY